MAPSPAAPNGSEPSSPEPSRPAPSSTQQSSAAPSSPELSSPSADGTEPVASTPRRRAILERGTYREYSRIEKVLTREATGGGILVLATIIALILANSAAADAYFGLRDTHLGFELFGLDLNLSIGHWAADGLLAIFFFMVGLELKMEFIQGDLRDPGKALVPVAAAVGGVAVPALIFFTINLAGPSGATNGWAIPAATDIAFAVAVLAIVGSKLPSALRTFLLTLAIMDDLLAIVIIAVFYSDDLQLGYLAIALIPLALYRLIAQKAETLFKKSYGAAWFVLLPLGAVVWALFYNSGIHATIAGVVLAFMVPVTVRSHLGREYSLAKTFEHRFAPLSSGFAVPVFAFFSAGVAVGGLSGLLDAWTGTIALGVMAGLVAGKIIGIVGTTFLITRLKRANLDPAIAWIDLIGMAALAGIGFTVSLLIAELSFPSDPSMQDAAKVGVLTASVLAAIVGSAILLPRSRHYAKIAEEESVDANQDGIPDVFSDDTGRQG
ncbi:Na+/H+ antiporter NhaA [Helcobacillus sp. ACRRO]|uniref:Na+/H+ antiporter NhaA n=1 Tax=Helcobacillus sp. ACRRO TaxID=2918202 RepID=UPI001EF55D89|nr:Na+/H+ antiporter NhaA [Helcobacillus sp. ACRRO]MCG7427195.1 Na+/H+ antiporter NhaA [Helcobacillus sp. ACRRO]